MFFSQDHLVPVSFGLQKRSTKGRKREKYKGRTWTLQIHKIQPTNTASSVLYVADTLNINLNLSEESILSASN